MKTKIVLKFYFCVDRLNKAIDNLILFTACKPSGRTEDEAETIIELIEKKDELSYLWRRIDGIMNTFGDGERETLEFYGCRRAGISNLGPERFREIKRVVTKFTRRARYIKTMKSQLDLLKSYRCLF